MNYSDSLGCVGSHTQLNLYHSFQTQKTFLGPESETVASFVGKTYGNNVQAFWGQCSAGSSQEQCLHCGEAQGFVQALEDLPY